MNRVSKTISDETLSRIIQIESGGRPSAKAATSSALGLGQFLNATWMATVQRHRPDLLEGRSKAQVLALRTDPAVSIEMLARFTEENAKSLGRGYTDGDLYLAHFSGVGVARKLLRAPADDPASKHFTAAAIEANRSILAGKSVGEVRAWAARKMAAAGKTNWVARYWSKNSAPAASPESPEATPPHNQQSAEIRTVQQQLSTMGYHEVGTVDGKWGGRTAAAIAAFKNDRGLAGDPLIDADLTAELQKASDAFVAGEWKRPISKDRAEKTAKELEPTVAPLKESAWSRLWARVITIPSMVVAAFGGIIDNIDAAKEKVQPVLDVFSTVPWWMYALAVGGAGIMVWRSANRNRKQTAGLYNDGRLVS